MRHQTGPDGICFNVAENIIKMSLILDGKTFVAALVNVSTAQLGPSAMKQPHVAGG